MNKKLIGAILSGAAFIIYYVVLFGVFVYFDFITDDMPVSIFLIICFLLMIPLTGIIIALVLRIREIQEGEEEEASKY